MGTEERTATAGLIEHLRGEARRFSFFQVARLAETAGAGEIGSKGPASAERIRFRPELTLAHAASDVRSVEALEDPDGTERMLVETTFLGLYGSTSPLPSHFTEELLHEHEEDAESLVRGFLDLFHHRLIALFYRCWKKYRHHIQFRRGARDEFSRRMLCLVGLDVPGAEQRLKIPRALLMRYSGLLAQRPCSAASLRCILADYFRTVDVEVTPCVKRWVVIAEPRRCRLGLANSTLGVDAQIGERVADRSGKFRVSLGPMEMGHYNTFLPGGRNLEMLQQLLRVATADLLAYEVELKLHDFDLPVLCLQENSVGARLGHASWLGGQVDQAGVVLQCHGTYDQPGIKQPEGLRAASAGV